MDKIQPLITSIPEKLDAINEVLVKGSSISYFNAIGLGRKSGDVCSTINKIVAQYEKGFKPTEEEAKILLEVMTKIVERSENQLSLLIDTKPVFDNLWVSGLVKKDTTSLSVASTKLSETMIKVAPEGIKAEAQALEERRKVAFEKALAVYGNAKGGEDKADDPSVPAQ